MRDLDRPPKSVPIFTLDDRKISELLADLTLYDYVPALAPIKNDMLRLTAKVAKLRETTRGTVNDKIRGDYEKIIAKFYALFDADSDDGFKQFLHDRKRIDAGMVLMAASPY